MNPEKVVPSIHLWPASYAPIVSWLQQKQRRKDHETTSGITVRRHRPRPVY